MAGDNTGSGFPCQENPRCGVILCCQRTCPGILCFGVGVLMGLAEVRAGYRRAAAEEMPCFLVALRLCPSRLRRIAAVECRATSK
jgi:hypothetical protein